MARTAPRPQADSAARQGRLDIWGLGALLALAAACQKEAPLTTPERAAPEAARAGEPSGEAAAGVQRPSVVLLLPRQDRLLALACYDGRQKTMRAGDACAALLPDPLAVQLADGRIAHARRAAPYTCQTPEGAVPHPSFSLINEAPSETPGEPPGKAAVRPAPQVALWSSGPRPKLDLPPSPPEAIPLPPSERQAIRTATALLLPAAQRLLLGDVTIDSAWITDLDADGLHERLDQVRLFDIRGRFVMLTGIFMVPGQDAVAPRPLRAQIIPWEERERLGPSVRSYDTVLVAAVDLDHDGRRELWMQLLHPGLVVDTVGRLTDGGLTTFAELACPPAPDDKAEKSAATVAPPR